MKKDVVALIPELVLLAGAVATLLVGSFSRRDAQWRARIVALVAAAGCIVAAGVAFATESTRMVYGYGYAIDTATHAARLIVGAALILAIVLSVETVRGRRREAEFYVLMLLAALGAIALAGATDLLVLVVALLLSSLPLSALIGWARDSLGTEATVKFFLLGALSSVTMVIGITVLFGAAQTTSYRLMPDTIAQAPQAAVAAGVVAILAGLLFKAGAVPMHFWLPDAAQGATAPAAAFITTVPKVGALVALYRLFAGPLHDAPIDWPLLIAVVAAATMTLGNLAAFRQTHPRRLLAYSTVSQAGYLLMAVAVAADSDIALQALLLYLGAYAAANLGAFAIVAEFPAARALGDYAGLVGRHRRLALALAVCLLALVGTPPTAVFFGKLTVFSAAGDGGLVWLVVVAGVNTVASLFYYLRWIGPAFLETPAEGGAGALRPAGRWSAYSAYAAALIVLALGVASGAALDLFTGPLAGG